MKHQVYKYIRDNGPVTNFEISTRFGKSDMLGVLYLTRDSLKRDDEQGVRDGLIRLEAMLDTYYRHYILELVEEGKVEWDENFKLVAKHD